MRIIGLCGGSGSGKGSVAAIFSSLGVPSVDTDAVYHSITSQPSPCLNELVREFGDTVVKDGQLDRAALRDIVFDPEYAHIRQPRLNEITHKYVIAEVITLLSEQEANGAIGCIIDAPLLFESGLDKRCDTVIAVVADRELRISRIVLRDSIDRARAERRIDSQMSDAELSLRADFVIINNGGHDELERKVMELYDIIFKK